MARRMGLATLEQRKPKRLSSSSPSSSLLESGVELQTPLAGDQQTGSRRREEREESAPEEDEPMTLNEPSNDFRCD